MKEKLLYLLLFICIFATGQAQNQKTAGTTFTIKGQVVDSLTNESVPYATLRIASASAPQTPIKLLACDDDGKFTGTMNAPGKYIMTIESLGQTPTQKSFTLNENSKTLNLGKLLMSENSQQLSEVTVTDQKPLVKVEIDKVT